MSGQGADANMTDDEIVQAGTQFGYGTWLQPIINANNQPSSETAIENQPTHVSLPTRRGRGRPRLTKPRDESAIEKRREQVRLAQRSYQKRKETATKTEKQRIDELLQVLSDLSSDVEALLQAAATSGTMYRDDDVSIHIQRLWSSYDTAIHKDCVQPELRPLQAKNDQRIAVRRTCEHRKITSVAPVVESEDSDSEIVVPPKESALPFDPNTVNLDLVRFEETTLVQSFQRSSALERVLAGRGIFDVVKERQAARREAERADSTPCAGKPRQR